MTRLHDTILGILVSTATLVGQTLATGTIAGTIVDPSGAAIPGARIQIHSDQTGVDREVTSNGAGVYSAPLLQPGEYQLATVKTGFSTVVRKGLTLEVGRTLTVDVALTVAGTESTVTVYGTPELVESEKTEVSQSVSPDLVSNLPIVGRRWDNFVLLTAGVTTDGALVSYHGISGLYNTNLVDGANNNQAFFSGARGGSTVPYTYSLDSIEEFQVLNDSYSAEFGQAAGGTVNAVTRSGGNVFHGDLFYYLRYPALNALDPVNRLSGINTQSIHQQQQFGGSIGGPLIRDKLFLFLTYDGSRKVTPISFTSTSKFPLPCPVQVTAAQCGAANNYLSGLVGAYPRDAVQDLAFGRLDYQANRTNHLSANFDFDDFHEPSAFVAANSNGVTVSNGSVTGSGPSFTHTRFLVANWDTIISPRLINNLRFQWGIDFEATGVNSGGPSVSIANVMAYGEPSQLPRPQFPNEHRTQLADTLSWTHGRHQIKAGFDFNFIHEAIVNLFFGDGSYSYTGSATAAFNNWVLDVFGINTGDGLTGRHYQSFTQVNDPITHVGKDDFWDNDYAGFAEDTWRLRSNLTLNLGVRYDIQTTSQPPQPNTATPLLAALTSKINTDSNNFAPRLGIAWQPLKQTSVRAGYGIFYGKTSNSMFYGDRVENGVYQQQFNCGPTTTCAPIFPNVIFTPPGPAPAAPFLGALTPQVINTNPSLGILATHGLATDFVNPLVHEGNLTVERQLPGGFVVSGGYVFSRALHLPVYIDANVAPSTTTKTYDILNSNGTLAQTITEPFYTQRINPSTGVILTGYSIVNSWYNGMLLSLRHPLSHGIDFLFNYTWSKSIDDGAVSGQFGTFYGTDVSVNPYNQKQENALSDLNQRQRFVGSLVWTPLFTKRISNKAARAVADGFVFSTVMTFATGFPVTGQISGFPSNGVDGGLTGGAVSNTAAATGGRLPWIGRNTFPGPGMSNIDLRVMRQFTIRERMSLQFLGEAFNLFNHTNIFSVNTTAYTYAAVGGSGCSASANAGTNGCLIPSPTFLVPTSSSSANGLYGARQLQVSAKFIF
jgi:outer membrane receptor protein involved in Fe transport